MQIGVVDFILLGCSKNLVDAERVMRSLEAVGWRCVPDAPEPKGEICVINTCGFIGDAKEESVRMILEMGERKKRGLLKRLYVMGCLSERYRADLEKEIPEVDAYFGKFDFERIMDYLQTPSKTNTPYYERHLTTPRHYAYLKISEGCNRMCSIPGTWAISSISSGSMCRCSKSRP